MPAHWHRWLTVPLSSASPLRLRVSWMDSEVVLCLVLTCFYLLLFVSSLVQLLRIVSAQHDLYSFQFGFLLLAVLWSGLRVFFFGEWFGLPELLSLLLWWLPFDLQFSTFSLLILFYASLLHHNRWHQHGNKRMLYVSVLMVVNVLVPVLTTAWAVTSVLQSRAIGTLEAVHHAYMACQQFSLFAVFLYHGYRLHSSHGSSHLLASLLRPLFPLPLLTTLCLIVFLSRALFAVLNCLQLYELEIGGDEGGWKLVSPVAFVLLLLWEVLPTAAVILFFHHIPSHGRRKWHWPVDWCGCQDECDTGRLAARGSGGGAAAGGDGERESERSGSPHSASSRLSYSTADELDAELLQSASSLSSHSFSSAVLPAALQQSQQLTAHAALHSHSSSLPPAVYQPPTAQAAPANHRLQPSAFPPSAQQSPRSSLSSPPASVPPAPFPSVFSSSFSPPPFTSAAVLSPSVCLSPSPSSPSSPSPGGAVAAVLVSPGGRSQMYGRATERWRLRRDGGINGALDGSAGSVIPATAAAAATARSTTIDDDDEYEYRAEYSP